MTDEKERPFSPAMVSALQAVARMKSGSEIAWCKMIGETTNDNRHPLPPESQKG